MSPGSTMSYDESNSVSGASNSSAYTIPKLSSDGSNWITYKARIVNVMRSRGLKRHLDGLARAPPPALIFPQPSAPTAAATAAATAAGPVALALITTATALAALTDEEYLAKVEASEKKVDDHDQKEGAARQLIYGTITNALLLQVQDLPTVAEVWTAVQFEFEGKSEMYSVALRTRLNNTKCEEGADVRAHLDSLLLMWAELATMGVPMSDSDFTATIYTSLPKSYGTLLTALTPTARIMKVTVGSKDVIFAVNEEFDRTRGSEGVVTALAAKAASSKAAYGASRSSSRGRGGSNSNGRGPTGSKPDVECFNCHRKGHVKADCWHAGGGKEGQGPRQGGGKRGGGQGGAQVNTAGTAAAGDTYAFTTTFYPDALLTRTAATPKNVITEVFDSGANRHISPYRNVFTSFESSNPHPISAADSRTFNVLSRGDVKISLPNGSSETTTILKDVLYAPELAFTLVSISRIDDAGFSSKFELGACEITSRKDAGRVIGWIPASHGLYRVEHKVVTHANMATPLTMSMMELHRRLGHISPASIERLVRDGRVDGIQLSDSMILPCDACAQAKIMRAPIPKARDSAREKTLGARIHTDVWGPAQTETIGKRRYYTSFTDNATRWTELYLLRQKSETFTAYKCFEAMLKVQDNKPIKALQSDRGSEYLSTAFLDHLAAQGTKSRLTVHDTPEQNGIAERLNRMLPEHTRAMLLEAGLPKNLWGEAMSHATWIKNRSPMRALDGKTPFEERYGKKPDLRDLHQFGCKVWVRLEDAGKLDAKAVEAKFVGYSAESKGGYRVYWPIKHNVTVERNVQFMDAPSVVVDIQPEGVHEVSNGQNDALTPEPVAAAVPEPAAPEAIRPDTPPPDMPPPAPEARKRRVRKPSAYVCSLQDGTGTVDGHGGTAKLPKGLQPTENIVGGAAFADEEISPPLDPFEVEAAEMRNLEAAMVEVLTINAGQDPQSLEEAMQSPDWPLWEAAIQKELASIKSYNTYTLVEAPPNVNVIGSKFVFQIKRNADGSVTSYKVLQLDGLS